MSRPTLPRVIEAAYAEAVEKTGETDTLKTARQRIAHLLHLGPHGVEFVTADLYQRMV